MTKGYAERIDWRTLRPRIVWNRCHRRQWTATATLTFSREQRRKVRHVLLYFWAGEGVRGLPGGEMRVGPGVCHWSRPGWSYFCHQSPSNPLGVTAIHFDLVDDDGRVVPPGRIALPEEILPVDSPNLVHEATQHIAHLAMEMRSGVRLDEMVREAAETLFHGLLLHVGHGCSSAPVAEPCTGIEWDEVVRMIHDTLANSPDIGQLAANWGYSRFHFTRLFSQRFGLSPKRYMMNARLALAKELLRESDMPIGQVADLAGFGDVAYFSNWFRAKTGQSPSAYRSAAAHR